MEKFYIIHTVAKILYAKGIKTVLMYRDAPLKPAAHRNPTNRAQ